MKLKQKLLIGVILVFALTASLYAIQPSLTDSPSPNDILATRFGLELHVTMRQYRDGVLIFQDHHAGVITTAGLNWVEDQLGDSPSTDPAKWIALSNDGTAPSAAWTEIPAEITTGNMGRAAGTYASTGDGVWEIENVFSPSETASCQLTGLCYTAAGAGLLASDTFTQINYENGDTVTITWELTQT